MRGSEKRVFGPDFLSTLSCTFTTFPFIQKFMPVQFAATWYGINNATSYFIAWLCLLNSVCPSLLAFKGRRKVDGQQITQCGRRKTFSFILEPPLHIAIKNYHLDQALAIRKRGGYDSSFVLWVHKPKSRKKPKSSSFLCTIKKEKIIQEQSQLCLGACSCGQIREWTLDDYSQFSSNFHDLFSWKDIFNLQNKTDFIFSHLPIPWIMPSRQRGSLCRCGPEESVLGISYPPN